MATCINVSPSTRWKGNDGNWSTFDLNVGSALPSLDVLPATSISFTLVVLYEEGCLKVDTVDQETCEALRGGLLDPTTLHDPDWQSWKNSAGNDTFYVLPAEAELPFHDPVAALLSLNSLKLSWVGGIDTDSSGFLSDQVIAGFAAKEPFIGQLGISGRQLDLKDASKQYNSTLLTLRDVAGIPGASWAYTAGAHYKALPAFGSLTFGGYDASLVHMDTALTVHFTITETQDLWLTIKAISFNNATPESTNNLNPTIAYIDSMVTEFRLPRKICDEFETQFGLSWNESMGMYPVNESHHELLLKQNMSVRFTLASSATSDGNTTIELPYAAFDLVARWPLANITEDGVSQRYFPLKPIDDPGPYVLGRAFLQEAYVSADYDRGQFQIGQALFPRPPVPRLVDIYFPGTEPKKHGIGAGVIAGVVIAAVALISIVAALFWWMRRRRAKKQQLEKRETRAARAVSVDEITLAAVDLEMTDRTEYFKPAQELSGSSASGPAFTKHELDANTTATNPTGRGLTRHELATTGTVQHRPGPGHQHNWSFGSSQSGISPMAAEHDRISSAFGEPSPPLNYFSGSPSPPLPDRRHERPGSPIPPFEMP